MCECKTIKIPKMLHNKAQLLSAFVLQEDCWDFLNFIKKTFSFSDLQSLQFKIMLNKKDIILNPSIKNRCPSLSNGSVDRRQNKHKKKHN